MNVLNVRLAACLTVLGLVAVGAFSLAAGGGGPLALAAQSPPAAAAPAKAKDYSGKYLADGIGNGGRPYKAMVEISREGEVYQVLWVLGPREAYMGVGLTEADTLCVGWSTGQVPGLIVYKAEGDKLVGRWTAPGAEGKTFKETLTPVK